MRSSAAPASLAALLAVALLVPGCSPSVQPPRPGTGILVIAVDALRADHLNAYGYDPERRTSPRLDRLAGEGVLFRQAFSSAPSILPAHVGLLTGCSPLVARRLLGQETPAPERRWRIPRAVPRLAVELLSAGYRTAAFMDHPRLAPLNGFAAGFEELVEAEGEDQAERLEPTTRRSVDRFLQWLRSVDRDESWFAYLHVNDLDRFWGWPDPRWDDFFQPRGDTYVPPVGSTDSALFAMPRGRWRGGVRSLSKYEAMYDGQVRRLDTELEHLFTNLDVLKRYERTTIVVVGSTGIQFGEAGLVLSSGLYSMADLHVPWILKPDAEVDLPRGLVHEGVVGTLDLAPTLIELAGLSVPAGTHGRSLLGELHDRATAPDERVVFAACGLLEGCVAIGPRYVYERMQPDRVAPQLRRSWLGTSTPWAEAEGRFYDRTEPSADLGATGDRLPGEADGARRTLEELTRATELWMERVRRTRLVLQLGTAAEGVTPADVAELQRLGYLGSGLQGGEG